MSGEASVRPMSAESPFGGFSSLERALVCKECGLEFPRTFRFCPEDGTALQAFVQTPRSTVDADENDGLEDQEVYMLDEDQRRAMRRKRAQRRRRTGFEDAAEKLCPRSSLIVGGISFLLAFALGMGLGGSEHGPVYGVLGGIGCGLATFLYVCLPWKCRRWRRTTWYRQLLGSDRSRQDDTVSLASNVAESPESGGAADDDLEDCVEVVPMGGTYAVDQPTEVSVVPPHAVPPKVAWGGLPNSEPV